MSAGVSEQRMKGQSNQVISSSSKNVETEERTSIPWSQQVDEASFENLSSSTEGNQSGCCESSNAAGTQFQYPPFNVKDVGWPNAAAPRASSRRLATPNSYDNNGMYGQPFGHSTYNYFPKNGDYNWSSQNITNSSHHHSRRSTNFDEYKYERNNTYHNDNIKTLQRGIQNMGLESANTPSTNDTNPSNISNTKPDTQVASVPKKMTWASIASQPAKTTMRTSSSSSTLKKKGPGMPPPPMVPGKHNMDIGTWDSPKNGPVLVPPPPPPVIPVPIMEPFPLGQSKSSSGSSNTGQSSKEDSGSGTAQQQKTHRANNQLNNNQSSSAPSNANQNVRPPWISQNNVPPNSKNVHHNSSVQHARTNAGQGSLPTAGGQANNVYHNQVTPLVVTQPQHGPPPQVSSPTLSNSSSNHPLLEELTNKNNYNPPEIDMEKAAVARFFVIKSYSEDDIHRSIKYEIWCSTEHGNKRLDEAFRERESVGGVVYLFFSVNSSGHFCGMAQMMTPVDYNSVSSVWSQDKWKGTFKVKWIYVKDVPNTKLRHIRLENNEDKSVTNSRDAQEVPNLKGQEVLRIFHSFEHLTSIFDDFIHYEKRQEEEVSKKYEPPHQRQVMHEASQNIIKPHRGDYDNRYHGGSGTGTGYRDRNFSRGGYHNYDNRRNDEHRGFERLPREGKDGQESPGHFNSNRENNGEFHNSRGFHRDYRREERSHSGYNRERNAAYHDGNNPGGFMNRGDNGRGGGGFRDSYNRDRDHYSRGRGRGGGGHRN